MTGESNGGISRICVYIDPVNPPYAGLIQKVISVSEELGISLSASEPSVEYLSKFDIPEDSGNQAAMVLGGDGTILRGVKYFWRKNIPVLGINTGHLGFLASSEIEDLPETLALLAKGEYRIVKFPLLRGELPSGQVLTCMNDFCINRSILGGILHYELFLDKDLIAVVAGDGLVFSTPLGSTAYGLSCGGPILDPGLPAMLVIPICPHQLSLRPMVVPDSIIVTVVIGRLRGGPPFVSVDGKPEASLSEGESLRVTRDPGYFSVIHIRDRGSHYSHMGRKLGWGIRGGVRSADKP